MQIAAEAFKDQSVNRLDKAVLTSLSRNKKNNEYPCKPQFYYIKVRFKGVKIIYACFRDTEDGPSVAVSPCFMRLWFHM